MLSKNKQEEKNRLVSRRRHNRIMNGWDAALRDLVGVKTAMFVVFSTETPDRIETMCYSEEQTYSIHYVQ